MLELFERLLNPTKASAHREPPRGLTAFYWHYLRQTKGLFVALFVAGLLLAILDSLIPVFLGRLVTLTTSVAPSQLFVDFAPLLLGMAFVILIFRPLTLATQNIIINQAITANVPNMIRWQSFRQLMRQSWRFFQNDLTGRLASRVMQTGQSITETFVVLLTAIWYITVYGATSVIFLASADRWLTLPLLIWFCAYLVALRALVPRMRERSKTTSEARSALAGRLVDSFGNILTVKLFARARDEDTFVADSIDQLTDVFHISLRLNTLFSCTLSILNGLLVTCTGALAMLLWSRGQIEVGAVAMALPMVWQISNASSGVAWQVTSIFENVGAVQEGMMSIAQPIALTDRPHATQLHATRGEIVFEGVHFGYGRDTGVLDGFTLTVRPGEKIGLVGRSGVGKSTVVNLLLRFFELDSGRVLIDGQDISTVTQESLRSQISVVTQDTSLFHRSIADNIRYGRPDATLNDIVTAAKLAQADDFINCLEDDAGRCAYAAHVGERGVNLSGGQRQRIAIARVILKNAPILVLDEATSALDSDVEAAIQDNISTLITGKTVIAIAHRLSTIAHMDRLAVLDRGRLVEEGTHKQLLGQSGYYAALWRRQSGGFLNSDDVRKVDFTGAQLRNGR